VTVVTEAGEGAFAVVTVVTDAVEGALVGHIYDLACEGTAGVVEATATGAQV